jgi:hypothetical protein
MGGAQAGEHLVDERADGNGAEVGLGGLIEAGEEAVPDPASPLETLNGVPAR